MSQGPRSAAKAGTGRAKAEALAFEEIDDKKILRLPDGHRYATLRIASLYGKFSVARCYALLDAKRIKAKKFDRKTLVDLDSIDEMYANLPDR